MDSASDWLTWPEAAELVGCPVPTIDWHTRTGRIKKRPRHGNRPSLDRASVEEFAAWWTQRQADKELRKAKRVEAAQRRQERSARAQQLGVRLSPVSPLSADSSSWLTTEEAATVLGVSVSTVRRLARSDTCRAVQLGTRWWLREEDIQQINEQRQRWVSYQEAARIVGCSEGTIKHAVERGRIDQRDNSSTALPSLARASVERFAKDWRAERERRVSAEIKPPASAPPEDGHVWLDMTTTALVLGISRSRVSQLAQEDRLPHVLRGRRRWFRLEHMEQIAAARALTSRCLGVTSVR